MAVKLPRVHPAHSPGDTGRGPPLSHHRLNGTVCLEMKVFSSLRWGRAAAVTAAGDLDGGAAVTGDQGDKTAFSSKSVNLRVAGPAGRAALGPGLRGATGAATEATNPVPRGPRRGPGQLLPPRITPAPWINLGSPAPTRVGPAAAINTY